MPLVRGQRRGVRVVIEDDQLRTIGEGGRERMDRQLAEATTEGNIVLDAELLVPEDQDLVLDERGANDLELSVARRVRKVDVANLRTEIGCDLLHAHPRPTIHSLLLHASSWSVYTDHRSFCAGELRHLGPLLGFADHQLAEFR